MCEAFLLPCINNILIGEEEYIAIAVVGHLLNFLPGEDLSFIFYNARSFGIKTLVNNLCLRHEGVDFFMYKCFSSMPFNSNSAVKMITRVVVQYGLKMEAIRISRKGRKSQAKLCVLSRALLVRFARNVSDKILC